ncbi:hypothetical protein GCM10009846_28560 [Agrococcus versicolor]|uniref:DUF998 domain-containing protein n=1 Tax=Agrococcus versicolor TaxID=501482 RepID=A0ABN3AXL6_9MICO
MDVLRPVERLLATADLGARSRRELEAVAAALVSGAIAFVGGLVALAILRGETHPLAGPRSVGGVAAAAAAVTAGASFVGAYLRTTDPRHVATVQRLGSVVRVLAGACLTVVSMGFAYIAILTISLVFQEGFAGLEMDTFAGALAVAIAGGVAAYLAHPLGEEIDTRVLGMLVPAFLVVGVLFSMLTASDSTWWEVHFSELGAGGGISGIAFNGTLVVSGLLVATMAAYITHDLERAVPEGGRTAWVGRLLATIGILMLLTGVVRVDWVQWLHIGLAAGMVLVFLVLCSLLPWLAPGLPRGVHAVSILMVAGTLFALVLWVPIGYYNFTGFEFAACGLIFVWLTTFLRAIAAVTDDRDAADRETARSATTDAA